MVRDKERLERSLEKPLIGDIDEMPGLSAAMLFSLGFEFHLHGLSDVLLAQPFPGATLTRAERELIATVVAAKDDCFVLMDSHAAVARELLRRSHEPLARRDVGDLLDSALVGSLDSFPDRLKALLQIACTIRRRALELREADVQAAMELGATEADVRLTIFIAAAISMKSRLVDGLRAISLAEPEAYKATAARIAERGYLPGPGSAASPPAR